MCFLKRIFGCELNKLTEALKGIMAKLTDLNESLAAQTIAINDLTAALGNQAPSVPESDLDAVKAEIDANTDKIKALIPTQG